MRTAVVMTVNDRPRYLEQTLSSWRRAYSHATRKPAMIFGVEPGDHQSEQVDMIRGYFATAMIHAHTEKLGVLKHPLWLGGVAGVGGFDNIVFAEDDVLVSDDVMALADFAYRLPDVVGMGAFTNAKPVMGISHQPHLVEIGDLGRFSSLVWSVDSKTFLNILAPTWDTDYSSGDESHSGWDWNICLRVAPANNLRWLFPLHSRSTHIGDFGGTHMLPSQAHRAHADTWKPSHLRAATWQVVDPALTP